MTPFLNSWIEPAKLSYRQHLTEFLQKQLDSVNFILKHKQLSSPWLRERLEQSSQVIRWLKCPTTSQQLETSFFGREKDDIAEETLKAADLLSTLTHYLPQTTPKHRPGLALFRKTHNAFGIEHVTFRSHTTSNLALVISFKLNDLSTQSDLAPSGLRVLVISWN